MKGSALLVKLLTISGAGGGPVIFYGLPSTDTEGQRQFKWLLSFDTESIKGGQLIEGSKQSETWSFAKSKFQGVSEERWKELAGEDGRSVYKLVFKKEWDQNENKITGNKSVKGSVGLVKVSWERNGYQRVSPSLIGGGTKVEEASKVWLIIAKSQSSIYLIPVVRSSAKWGDSRNEEKMKQGQDTKEIWTKGVKDIKTWSYDNGEDWKKGRNEQLQKSLNSGFSIMRGKDTVFVGRNGENWIKNEGDALKEWWRKRVRGSVKFADRHNGEFLYQNAGILKGRGNKGRCNECKQAEKYFPLDIAVLGNQSKLRNLSDWYGNLVQELEVNDTITQVVGVRLDEVVINETGIGDGKGGDINWGTVNRPTLIRELLK